MRIEIKARGFELSPALKQHVERKLHPVLNRPNFKASLVRVQLSDVNGPRGGADKRCSLEFAGSQTPLIVHDTHEDMYLAIDRAIARSKHSLARRSARRRAQLSTVHGKRTRGFAEL